MKIHRLGIWALLALAASLLVVSSSWAAAAPRKIVLVVPHRVFFTVALPVLGRERQPVPGHALVEAPRKTLRPHGKKNIKTEYRGRQYEGQRDNRFDQELAAPGRERQPVHLLPVDRRREGRHARPAVGEPVLRVGDPARIRTIESHCTMIREGAVHHPVRLAMFGFIGANRRLSSILRALASYPERQHLRLDIYGTAPDKRATNAQSTPYPSH